MTGIDSQQTIPCKSNSHATPIRTTDKRSSASETMLLAQVTSQRVQVEKLLSAYKLGSVRPHLTDEFIDELFTNRRRQISTSAQQRLALLYNAVESQSAIKPNQSKQLHME
ncbi:putative SlyX protein [Trichinella spiralis]|uniref:Uncharacterized protein n=1 Tax=Trichinella spiralis TaxID=6334 RepID=E5STK3_TRISP|nr:putative SlyX protein [Trichinella spiralis]KRY30169.1 hypothetical protein T01_9243 [Trichinella spiralis]